MPGTAGVQRPHGIGHARCPDRSRPLLHHIPRRQIQELSHAAGDGAEHVADPTSPVRGAPLSRASSSEPDALPDLRQTLGLVERRVVEQREDERDELVLRLRIPLERRQQLDRLLELRTLSRRRVVFLQIFEFAPSRPPSQRARREGRGASLASSP